MSGAQVTTGSPGTITIAPNGGPAYFRGIAFKATVGQSSSSPWMVQPEAQSWICFENCSLEQHGTSSVVSTSNMIMGQTTVPGIVILRNSSVRYGHVSHHIVLYSCQLIWQNSDYPVLTSGSALADRMFDKYSGNNSFSSVTMEGLDLWQFTKSFLAGPLVRRSPIASCIRPHLSHRHSPPGINFNSFAATTM
jgi:hypothetical protein